MNASAKISPNHFAAPGKRVQSSYDPSEVGTVTAWLNDGETFVVLWDGACFATTCSVFDIDPLHPIDDAPKPETILAIPGEQVEVGGFRGVIRAIHWASPERWVIKGVFVLSNDEPRMLYVKTGARMDGVHSFHARRFEVVEVRETTRDEFDKAMGLDEVRAQMGWRF